MAKIIKSIASSDIRKGSMVYTVGNDGDTFLTVEPAHSEMALAGEDLKKNDSLVYGKDSKLYVEHSDAHLQAQHSTNCIAVQVQVEDIRDSSVYLKILLAFMQQSEEAKTYWEQYCKENGLSFEVFLLRLQSIAILFKGIAGNEFLLDQVDVDPNRKFNEEDMKILISTPGIDNRANHERDKQIEAQKKRQEKRDADTAGY